MPPTEPLPDMARLWDFSGLCCISSNLLVKVFAVVVCLGLCSTLMEYRFESSLLLILVVFGVLIVTSRKSFWIPSGSYSSSDTWVGCGSKNDYGYVLDLLIINSSSSIFLTWTNDACFFWVSFYSCISNLPSTWMGEETTALYNLKASSILLSSVLNFL